MKKMINRETIQGRVYQHSLSVKKVKNQSSANFGKDYISGDVEVATDEDGLNVISVHFSYVTPDRKASPYGNLIKIMEGKTWVADGKDEATKVRIDGSLSLNDFYVNGGELVSVRRNEGSFVSIINELPTGDLEKDRHSFKVDMVINGVKVVTPDENNDHLYASISGAIFNFRNEIYPVKFVIKNPKGIEYFDHLGASPKNLIFTNLWGIIVSTVEKKKQIEESAFGEPCVTYTEKPMKEWVITGTSPTPYEFGDVNVLTKEDIEVALQNREIKLATLKSQREEYEANKTSANANSFSSGTAMNVPVGGFNF